MMNVENPEECYEFKSPFKKYYYTSSPYSIFFNQNEFLPRLIQRGVINGGIELSRNSFLSLKIDPSDELVQDCMRNLGPNSIELILLARKQPDEEFSPIWRGKMGTLKIDRMAVLNFPSILGSIFSCVIPNVYYQSTCNHILYDKLCAVDKKSHSKKVEILENHVNVVFLKTPLTEAENFFKGGEINIEDGKERRLIYKSKGSKLTLNFPLSLDSSGKIAEITPGCDHSLKTCEKKFSNQRNYGGFPLIPDKNPFH